MGVVLSAPLTYGIYTYNSVCIIKTDIQGCSSQGRSSQGRSSQGRSSQGCSQDFRGGGGGGNTYIYPPAKLNLYWSNFTGVCFVESSIFTGASLGVGARPPYPSPLGDTIEHGHQKLGGGQIVPKAGKVGKLDRGIDIPKRLFLFYLWEGGNLTYPTDVAGIPEGGGGVSGS